MRPRTRIALAIAVVLATLYVARAPLLTAVANALTVDTVAPGADYIIPLGGGAETRPFTAAELYRVEVAPRVLIFRYAASEAASEGLVPAGTDLYRRILELEGVPPSAIGVVPGEVNSTWDEAVAVRQILPPGQPVSLVVVTSPEHTRRARWAFKKVFGDTPVEVRMAPARHPDIDETNWWRHDAGVLTYLHEYLKLPYYWMRYTFSTV